MSVLPLYSRAREPLREQDTPALHADGAQWLGHPGLWYDKFFDRWKSKFEAIEQPDGKKRWIEAITKRKAGDGALIAEVKGRREALLDAWGFAVELTLETPFVTGLGYEHPVENGFLWHPMLGAPYLPGSGVKGLLRSWVMSWADLAEGERKTMLRHFFGGVASAQSVGHWIFFDALPLEPVQLGCEVRTPHDKGWRTAEDPTVGPSDWNSPTPIPFLIVEPGAQFQFAFAPRSNARIDDRDGDIERIKGWLRHALDYLGAGAKTATGLGRFAGYP